MRQKIVDILALLNITEPLYWGKKVVHALPQPGAFKSHAVVANWVQPNLIRVDLRAGLSGKKLADKDLAHYPLQLQSETFFEFEVEGDEDDSKGKSGKSTQSDGGASMRKKASTELSGFFQSAQNEHIPTHARLARGVVMGMQIGQGALDKVFTLFCDQVRAAKVLATDLLVAAGKAVTRYTPPAFMSPRGDENKVYKYDRTKNEPMFGMAPT
jgi:hypothetical protein